MAKHFDIIQFYKTRNVDFIERGVNVKKGEVNISCPFCNSSSNPDPSYHLGVDPNTLYFSCWRNKKHRGRTLHRLIMKLLKVPFSEASKILGDEVTWLQEGSFEAFAADPEKFFNPEITITESAVLELPDEFQRFQNFRSSRLFESYLSDRHFHPDHLQLLTSQYDLRYCISGNWQSRIILPLQFDFELVTWTGRSINKKANLRYRSLSEKEGALLSIKDILFNFDELNNTSADVLFLVEGPFDALKLDFYGQNVGARATCVFSKTLRPSQAVLVLELAANYKKIVLLLDKGELGTEVEMDSLLAPIRQKVVLGDLPEGVGDPGELTATGVKRLVAKYR